MPIYQGSPGDKDMWLRMYWWRDEDPDTLDRAIRQKRADGQWYVTTGLMQGTESIGGPYPTLEAAEMLFRMGITN